MAAAQNQVFTHSSGDLQFKSRVDAVFASLGDLEKKHEERLPTEDQFAELVTERSPCQRLGDESSVSSARGRREQQSRRQNRRPARVPDHILHPEKWKKYSLEDDGSSSYASGGDSLNRQVALSFLNDLRKRKSSDASGSDALSEASPKLKHNFTIHSNETVKDDKRLTDEEGTEPSKEIKLDVKNVNVSENIWQSGGQSGRHHVMDTYEFGQAKFNKASAGCKRTSNSASEDRGKDTELSLDHLVHEDKADNSENTDLNLNDNVDQASDAVTHKDTETFNKIKRKAHKKQGLRKRSMLTEGDESDN